MAPSKPLGVLCERRRTRPSCRAERCSRNTRASRRRWKRRMNERLRTVLETHQLSCGAVISSSGDVIAREGDFDAFASAGLVSGQLGPNGSAKATFDYLEGQLLPRIWRQGEEFAFIDKPAPDFAVVVFGRRAGSAL